VTYGVYLCNPSLTSVCDFSLSFPHLPMNRHSAHNQPANTAALRRGVQRYGFQGQENGREHLGASNSWDFAYRAHDARLGRFFAVDPLSFKYPYNSVYSFSENVVINHIELEGLEKADAQEFNKAQDLLCDLKDRLSRGELSNKSVIDGVDLLTVVTSLMDDIKDASSATCNRIGGSYYCGKNAIQNVAINYDPVGYVNYVFDLAQEGKAEWNFTGKKTLIHPDLDQGTIDGKVNISGEIFGKSLNYSTSRKSIIRRIDSWRSSPDLQEEGSTHPYEMNRLLKRVGLKTESRKIYRKMTSGDISEISNACSGKLIPIVLDNYGIKKGTPSPAYQKWGIHYLAVHDVNQLGSGSYEIFYNEYGANTSVTRTEKQIFAGMRAYFIITRR
jgi:hypothetical protein